MLHEFIIANRSRIIQSAQWRVHERAGVDSDSALEQGVPSFLTLLLHALAVPAQEPPETASVAAGTLEIVQAAVLHGEASLKSGFSLAQVVHGYGDVCQIVTELASASGVAITPADFRVFNRCLDDAIAGAVTGYGNQRERDLASRDTERFGALAHELRNLVHTAILSFEVIQRGTVGLSGSTGALHARCLLGLRSLVERAVSTVRLEALSPHFESVSVADFLREAGAAAAVHAEASRTQFVIGAIDESIKINVDRQLLASAVSNLLLNAFKFSAGPGRVVSLQASATSARVLLEVADSCGGLAPGLAERLFQPFVRGGTDHSGLGLGLAIAQSAVRANDGTIAVGDVPGVGCVFTINLPRRGTGVSFPLMEQPEG
jgi:signal transduction histidine kinase